MSPEKEKQERRALSLTEIQLKEIAKETAKETIDQMLTKLGIDHTDPLAMQEDFQHLRQWREASQVVKRRTIGTIVGVFLAGALGMLWLGFKVMLNN